jgi:hypothetical protein
MPFLSNAFETAIVGVAGLIGGGVTGGLAAYSYLKDSEKDLEKDSDREFLSKYGSLYWFTAGGVQINRPDVFMQLDRLVQILSPYCSEEQSDRPVRFFCRLLGYDGVLWNLTCWSFRAPACKIFTITRNGYGYRSIHRKACFCTFARGGHWDSKAAAERRKEYAATKLREMSMEIQKDERYSSLEDVLDAGLLVDSGNLYIAQDLNGSHTTIIDQHNLRQLLGQRVLGLIP